jgi:hypothetical protein
MPFILFVPQECYQTYADAEIFFGIPDDTRAKDFQIFDLQEWEGFAQLFDSWPENIDEVRKKLQTVMIPF